MIVSLLFGLLPNIYSGYYVNLITTVCSICKIRFYITQSSTMTYRWFLTIACIDRYAQSHIAYRVVICVTIIWIVLPIHNLIYRITSGGQCTWLERRRKNNQSQIEDESVRILQVRDYQAIAMLFSILPQHYHG
ncbi:unnamed protein product [Adineta steineri]|uniref:Uncharacterized protein n=1 Tax=Adineta steineri TaxID=433720 RepID=A0A816BQR0_9BILA|nr:unnamed protein product [Adineta steineri]CAF1612229.1 unnamed protein product [Adineta steineri]